MAWWRLSASLALLALGCSLLCSVNAIAPEPPLQSDTLARAASSSNGAFALPNNSPVAVRMGATPQRTQDMSDELALRSLLQEKARTGVARAGWWGKKKKKKKKKQDPAKKPPADQKKQDKQAKKSGQDKKSQKKQSKQDKKSNKKQSKQDKKSQKKKGRKDKKDKKDQKKQNKQNKRKGRKDKKEQKKKGRKDKKEQKKKGRKDKKEKKKKGRKDKKDKKKEKKSSKKANKKQKKNGKKNKKTKNKPGQKTGKGTKAAGFFRGGASPKSAHKTPSKKSKAKAKKAAQKQKKKQLKKDIKKENAKAAAKQSKQARKASLQTRAQRILKKAKQHKVFGMLTADASVARKAQAALEQVGTLEHNKMTAWVKARQGKFAKAAKAGKKWDPMKREKFRQELDEGVKRELVATGLRKMAEWLASASGSGSTGTGISQKAQAGVQDARKQLKEAAKRVTQAAKLAVKTGQAKESAGSKAQGKKAQRRDLKKEKREQKKLRKAEKKERKAAKQERAAERAEQRSKQRGRSARGQQKKVLRADKKRKKARKAAKRELKKVQNLKAKVQRDGLAATGAAKAKLVKTAEKAQKKAKKAVKAAKKLAKKARNVGTKVKGGKNWFEARERSVWGPLNKAYNNYRSWSSKPSQDEQRMLGMVKAWMKDKSALASAGLKLSKSFTWRPAIPGGIPRVAFDAKRLGISEQQFQRVIGKVQASGVFPVPSKDLLTMAMGENWNHAAVGKAGDPGSFAGYKPFYRAAVTKRYDGTAVFGVYGEVIPEWSKDGRPVHVIPFLPGVNGHRPGRDTMLGRQVPAATRSADVVLQQQSKSKKNAKRGTVNQGTLERMQQAASDALLDVLWQREEKKEARKAVSKPPQEPKPTKQARLQLQGL